MKVDKSHHIDKGEPDEEGTYDYYYDYHIYKFSEKDLKLIARSYKGESEAHLLRVEEKGKQGFFSTNRLKEPLVLQALEYLRSEGKTTFCYLDENKGYIEFS